MKAKERKERKKKMNESLKSNEDQINKLISIQSENDGNIIKQDTRNKTKNISESKNSLSNSINKADMKKIKERKERKKRKNKMKEIEPANVENNINNNINNNLEIKENAPENIYDSEPITPIQDIQKNNVNSIPSDKKIDINNINNNRKIISVSDNSNNSINDNNNNDDFSVKSSNYKFLSKNYNEIKTENIKNFLKETNPEKPTNEQKETEIQNMIKIMQLKQKYTPNKDEKNYGYNIWKKIERNEDYIKNQQKIKDLKIKIKEEENDIEKILENNKEEIKNYNEKIIKLQNDLLNTKQGDIFYLEEENKIAEIQIQNLSATYQRLVEENKKEKENINYLLNEDIFKLTKELKKEIEEVKKIKHQIKNLGKKKPPNDIMKKIEVVMKYINKKNL